MVWLNPAYWILKVYVDLFFRTTGGFQRVREVMADALAAGPPGERSRRRWSGLQTRKYALARASVAALNLISCGPSDSAEIPCWFPDEAAVTLVRQDGESRRVALPGLPLVAPEVLLTSENPARPVRDVFVAASRDLWILSTGTPGATQGPVVPGGWLLARYDDAGRLLGRAPTPAGRSPCTSCCWARASWARTTASGYFERSACHSV